MVKRTSGLNMRTLARAGALVVKAELQEQIADIDRWLEGEPPSQIARQRTPHVVKRITTGAAELKTRKPWTKAMRAAVSRRMKRWHRAQRLAKGDK